jgi:uncharacterized SAM-binding protein YcdF (DUF218 family)
MSGHGSAEIGTMIPDPSGRLMPMTGLSAENAAASIPRGRDRPGAWRRLWRGLGWITTAACVAVPCALAMGFGWFISRVPADEIPLDRNADGIVVLTGGASRINDAIELLAAGRGRRLLISGANRTTNPIDISRLNPEFARWIRCCVDFDRPVNTRGNAVETRRWARSRGCHSLIVVTSSYHMPRALAEIAHELPDVALIAFPVIADRHKGDRWWANGAATKLLVFEYLKYLVTNVRLAFASGQPA